MHISINFTDDEIDMLDGWQGQCSDGVGENKSWTYPYWRYVTFDKDGITLDETQEEFEGMNEDAIKRQICERFIEITNDGMQYEVISELYYNYGDPRTEDIHLGERTANSIIKKLGGTHAYEETDLDELAARNAAYEKELNELTARIDKGKLELCDLMAELTGDDSYRGNPDSLGMKPSEFYKACPELAR